MKTRKRIPLLLIVLAVALAILPSSAFASPGRLAGLALTNATSWMLDADEGYFFLNPAILQKLRPQVWGDLTAFQAGLLLNPMGNFDVYAVTGLALAPGFAAVPAPAIPLTEELLRLGVSFPVGNISLGVSAFAGYTSQVNTATPTDNHNAAVGVNAGVIIPLSQTFNLDAAAGLTYWDYLRKTGGVNAYVAGTIDLVALARLNWVMAQNSLLHIYGQFNTVDRSYTLGAGGLTKDSTSNVVIGVSDELRVAEAVLVFAGVYGDASFHATAADENDIYSLVVNGGAEFGFTKELTGRLGIVKGFYTVNYLRSANTTTSSDGVTTLTAGLGLKLGDLALDSELGIPLLIGGPNFISGTVSPLSLVLSGTYYLGAAKSK